MANIRCEYPGCLSDAVLTVEDISGDTIISLCSRCVLRWSADLIDAMSTVQRGKDTRYSAPMVNVRAVEKGE